MQTAGQYFGEFTEGVTLKGKNASLGAYYSSVAVPAVTGGTNLFQPWTSRTSTGVNGTLGVTGTVTGVITNTTAPVSGTITGFFTIAATTGTAACTLWSTTAGTIATITSSATVGTAIGTGVLNASFTAGDTVFVKANTNAGSATCFVTFVTAN